MHSGQVNKDLSRTWFGSENETIRVKRKSKTFYISSVLIIFEWAGRIFQNLGGFRINTKGFCKPKIPFVSTSVKFMKGIKLKNYELQLK